MFRGARKISTWILLGLYIAVSQFLFKALATTSKQPIDLEISSVCYGKNIDIFDAKKNCWQSSFTTQAGGDYPALTVNIQHFPNLTYTGLGFGLNDLYSGVFVFEIVHPPPDIPLSRVKKYAYIGIIKIVV